MERNELAEKMEIIGQIFEIDGMSELLDKYEQGMKMIKFNAVTNQVGGLLIRQNKALADKVIALSRGISVEEVQQMDDAAFANALKEAIIRDIMGFFVSSPRSDGKK